MNHIVKRFLAGIAAASLCAVTSTATAGVIFTGGSGSLAASASFSIVGGKLQVVLTNTSAADALVPTDVLTAVFFSLAGVGSPVSALLGGSTVHAGPTGAGNVGGEWAYASVAGPGGASQGISSTGLGLFGNGNFGGSNLQGPDALDGLQYGITSAGDDISTGNTPMMTNALIKNSVTFLLDYSGPADLAGLITHVSFQYGTAHTEPRIPGEPGGPPSLIPEPQTLPLLGLGLLAAVFFRRQRRT